MKTFLQFLSESDSQFDLNKPGVHEVRHGKAAVTYGIHPTKPEMELISLRVPQAHRGNGHASAALKKLLASADREGKTVRLLASPLDKKTHLGKLVKLYSKHGFEMTGKTGNAAGEPWMERKPQSTNPKSS